MHRAMLLLECMKCREDLINPYLPLLVMVLSIMVQCYCV